MGETTDQIEHHIENRREDLQSNFQELESKVKSATDWRAYYRKHPGAMVAVAFGGGVLLSVMAARGRRSGSMGSNTVGSSAMSDDDVDASLAASGDAFPSARQRRSSNGSSQILDTWDSIKTALVGVAATKFKGMLGDVVPGFSQHLARAEASKGAEAGGAPTGYGAEGEYPAGRH